MRKFVTPLLLTMMLTAPGLQAEVYRWVDADGKVRFSDRKPADKKADNISDSVKNTNVDTSTKESRKLKTIFAQETDEEKRVRAKQASEDQYQTQRRCSSARNSLRILKGRVYFTDKEGKEVKVTEQERKERVKKMEAYIGKNCK